MHVWGLPRDYHAAGNRFSSWDFVAVCLRNGYTGYFIDRMGIYGVVWVHTGGYRAWEKGQFQASFIRVL